MVPDTPDVAEVLFGADGVADGKLNPAAVRPPTASDATAETPEDFLRQLEQEGT